MGDTQSTVAVLALGGTIAMTSDDPAIGVTPSLDAAAIVKTARGVDELAHVETRTISNVASPSISIESIVEALAQARSQIDGGAAGVIITQGTDTLEETAYLLDLLWERPEPLIVIGAMKASTQPGYDGASNLVDAVTVAVNHNVRDLGVLVVMNGEIHLARHVSKTHSTIMSAFASPGWGPIGAVIEGQVRLSLLPVQRFDALPDPADTSVRVPLFEVPLGDDGSLLSALPAMRPRAVVVAGAGGGHVPAVAVNACEELIKEVCPLIIATRTGAGTTLTRTYGYPGGDIDLIRRGAITAGYLTPRKARLLAFVSLQEGHDEGELRHQFTMRGF